MVINNPRDDYMYEYNNIINLEDNLVILAEDLDTIEEMEYRRDYHIPSNKNKSEESRLKNKIGIENIFDYLPYKVLIAGKVYQFTLRYKGPNGRIYLDNNIDKILGDNRKSTVEEVREIDARIQPKAPFKFHKQDTAYVLKDILNLLIDLDAVEIKDNLKLNGNIRIIESLDTIMGFRQ